MNNVAHSKRQVEAINISTFTDAIPVTGIRSALYVPMYVIVGMMWLTLDMLMATVIVEEELVIHARQ